MTSISTLSQTPRGDIGKLKQRQRPKYPVVCFFTIMVIPMAALAQPPVQGGKMVACTAEAKVCPDGSMVGRAGPDCDFTPCPENKGQGIMGTIFLSPACPGAERIPEPDNCKDKPYQTSLIATRQQSLSPAVTIVSDEQGRFKVNVQPGLYTIFSNGKAYPICMGSAKVVQGAYSKISIRCDTGMR